MGIPVDPATGSLKKAADLACLLIGLARSEQDHLPRKEEECQLADVNVRGGLDVVTEDLPYSVAKIDEDGGHRAWTPHFAVLQAEG